jgi:hypothetical protein
MIGWICLSGIRFPCGWLKKIVFDWWRNNHFQWRVIHHLFCSTIWWSVRQIERFHIVSDTEINGKAIIIPRGTSSCRDVFFRFGHKAYSGTRSRIYIYIFPHADKVGNGFRTFANFLKSEINVFNSQGILDRMLLGCLLFVYYPILIFIFQLFQKTNKRNQFLTFEKVFVDIIFLIEKAIFFIRNNFAFVFISQV